MYYQASNSEFLTSAEIQRLKGAGITWLLLEQRLPDSKLELIRNNGFSLIIMVPEFFPIPYRLTAPHYRYFEKSDSLLRFYRDEPAVKGMGLFAFGNWHQGNLADRLFHHSRPLLGENQQLITLDIRPFSSDDLFPFDGFIMLTRGEGHLKMQMENNPALSGILYGPALSKFNLRDFQQVLDVSAEQPGQPIFFYRDWFFQNSEDNITDIRNNISMVTHFYHHEAGARLANPPADDHGPRVNWPFMLMFLFWITYAVYSRINIIYRKSIMRFFLNYVFFANDILMRRIRFSTDVAVVFLFSCLISGIMGYASSSMVLDPVSREALIHYSPLLPGSWTTPASFFFIFFLFQSVILGILIAWIWLANRSHAHAWQIATFILWPQHLNFLVVTAGILILQLYPNTAVVLAITILFLTITLGSFFTTAYNMRRIYRTSPLYMATTYALFVLVVATLISWLVFGLDIADAWILAASLSS